MSKPTNHYERLIVFARAADDDPGENLSHLTPTDMVAKLISDGKFLTADLDWSECPAATRTEGIVSGQWRVRGTRIPVDALITNYHSGYSADQLATKIFEGLPVDVQHQHLIHCGLAGLGRAFTTTPGRPRDYPVCVRANSLRLTLSHDLEHRWQPNPDSG